MSTKYDAVVVGSGPNGLAAAITLAEAGLSVLVIEGKNTIGGGTRTLELTLPGFHHDVCSAIHPTGANSPFLARLPLNRYGLEWIHPPAALAQPLDDGEPIVLERSIAATAESLGVDAARHKQLFEPIIRAWPAVSEDLLGPLPLPPKHPFQTAAFGALALQPASWLARWAYRGKRARALFASQSAHSMLPLNRLTTAAYGIILTLYAHTGSWPIAKGGSQAITQAMAGYLQSLGGEIQTGWMVQSINELPPARLIFFDTSPRQMLQVAGNRLPPSYCRQLERYRYGQGVFKLDYALSEPIPWRNQGCFHAATVHLGASLEEIEASERAIWHGRVAARPFVLVAQPSLFDPTRAPAGKHTAWVYCHAPAGSTQDLTAEVEAQLERFAPGFKEVVLARHTMNSLEFERYNPNYVGGDINAGVQDLFQFFTRPTLSLDPYKTPAEGVYICSSSTPPGGGVHGLCGYNAAKSALRKM